MFPLYIVVASKINGMGWSIHEYYIENNFNVGLGRDLFNWIVQSADFILRYSELVRLQFINANIVVLPV